MKKNTTVLINRLAHNAKNELTTMRLALFNLIQVLEENPIKDEAQEFITALKTTLDQSLSTINQILFTTRMGTANFRSLSLEYLVYDLVNRVEFNERFQFESSPANIVVFSDEQVLKQALKLFFNELTQESAETFTLRVREASAPRIEIENVQVSFTERFNLDPQSMPFKHHLLRHWLNYLGIQINNTGKTRLELVFNQFTEERE